MNKSLVGLIALAVAGVVFMRKKASAVESGGDVTMNRKQLEQLAADIARSNGVDPDVLGAIIDVESNWDPGAVNHNDPTGAWGLVQLLYTTALSVDDKIRTDWASIDELRGPHLLLDPTLNLTLGAALVRMNGEQSPAVPGTLPWYEDIAALHNSGKPMARAPAVTCNKYVPRFLEKLAKRQGASNV